MHLKNVRSQNNDFDLNNIYGKWNLIHESDVETLDFRKDSSCKFGFYYEDTLILNGYYLIIGTDILLIRIGRADLFDEYFIVDLTKNDLVLKYKNEIARYKREDED